ncbi:MAG: helix-turn-helix domain-containing protein [Acidobacteria bacterium]|nr:helix-turn-helix domain-containing protein [Acidobacteriota bacterium]
MRTQAQTHPPSNSTTPHELIEKGAHDRQDIAALFKVSRTTLYRVIGLGVSRP